MSDKLDRYWRRFRKRQLFIENKYIGEVYKAVRQQFIDFLDLIRDKGYDYAKANMDFTINAEGIVTVLKKVYRAAAFMEANYILDSLGGLPKTQKRTAREADFGLGFDQVSEVVDEYFRIYQLTKSALPINKTTMKYIRDHLISHVDAGVPLNTAISNFRELALTSGDNPNNTISRQRARTIMQTESIRALSFGQLIGAYMSGVDVDKVWVTCNDERVRGATRHAQYPHTVLDRQVTSLFGAFQNGEPIKFPGDPEASISNTINCRCTQFFKPKQKPKPKPRPRQTSVVDDIINQILGTQPQEQESGRATRTLGNFLTDFFTGFMFGEIVSSIIE